MCAAQNLNMLQHIGPRLTVWTIIKACQRDGWFGVVVTTLVTWKGSATSSPVSIGIGDNPWTAHHPGHSGPLSLVIPTWVSATGSGGSKNFKEGGRTRWMTICQARRHLSQMHITNCIRVLYGMRRLAEKMLRSIGAGRPHAPPLSNPPLAKKRLVAMVSTITGEETASSA